MQKKTKKQLNSKDSKTAEFRNSLIYGSKHSFYKYRLIGFIQILSITSKFDTLDMFYKEMLMLMLNQKILIISLLYLIIHQSFMMS